MQNSYANVTNLDNFDTADSVFQNVHIEIVVQVKLYCI